LVLKQSLADSSISNTQFFANMAATNGPVCPHIPDGPPGSTFVSVDYEVFGQVQGCYFPKYAKETAEQKSIGGWVKNTKKGTIVGKLNGTIQRVKDMIQWLALTGSPNSKIEKVDLTNWEFMTQQEFKNFSVRF